MRTISSGLIAASVLAMFFVTGCAAFPQHGVPIVEKLPDKSSYATKPSVFLDARMFKGFTANNPLWDEDEQVTHMFKEAVDKAAYDSGMFSTYAVDPISGRDMDYTIRLELLDYGNPILAAISGTISGATLFLIPGAATDHYRLTATVFDREGTRLSSYEVNDSVTTWIGIWFIPFMGNSPVVVNLAVWENMMMKVFENISNDNLMHYAEASTHRTDAVLYER